MNPFKRFKEWLWPSLASDSEESLCEYLQKYGCPDCDCDTWEVGPEAGMATNIRCAGCHSEFNIAPMLGFAERIRYTANEE